MSKSEIFPPRNETTGYATVRNETIDLNFLDLDLSFLDATAKLTLREGFIIACYSLIILVSTFGNLIVCSIVIRNANMRRATYVFIANLAVSDLLMTILNIPFNVSRILLDNWPFGGFMCSLMPLVQVTSVYVSTFTMTCIAIDRYRAISKPFTPRLSLTQALLVIFFVWILALLLAIPHAVFNKVEPIFTFRLLYRCVAVYPANTSQWITLITVTTQYLLPLSGTGLVYGMIISRVWSRDVLGAVTESQLISQAQAKKKTIKMLMTVVILFAICWLPLNLYHILQEFTNIQKLLGSSTSTRSSTVFFTCHWLAMSSVCYNPFIYCWLNANFRSGAATFFYCFTVIGKKLRYSRTRRISETQCESETKSVDMRSGFMSNFSLYRKRSKTSTISPKYGTKMMHRDKERKNTTIAMHTIKVIKSCTASIETKFVIKKSQSAVSINTFERPSTKLHYTLKKCASWT